MTTAQRQEQRAEFAHIWAGGGFAGGSMTLTQDMKAGGAQPC